MNDVLEAVKAYRPPKKLHPIAMQAFDLYKAGNYKLDDAAVGELRKTLEAHYGDLKTLTDALCSLAAFIAYLMEVKQDQATAEVVAKLMKETQPQYVSLVDYLTKVLSDAGKAVVGVLDRFTDRDTSGDKRAPKYGEEPPPGTVPLKSIKPVAQPPPKRKK